MTDKLNEPFSTPETSQRDATLRLKESGSFVGRTLRSLDEANDKLARIAAIILALETTEEHDDFRVAADEIRQILK